MGWWKSESGTFSFSFENLREIFFSPFSNLEINLLFSVGYTYLNSVDGLKLIPVQKN